LKNFVEVDFKTFRNAKENIKTLYNKINQALEYDKVNPLNPSEFMENASDTTNYIPREQ